MHITHIHAIYILSTYFQEYPAKQGFDPLVAVDQNYF